MKKHNKIILLYILTLAVISLYSSSSAINGCKFLNTLTIRQCKNAQPSTIDTLTTDCLIAKHLIRYTNYFKENEIPCSSAVDLMLKRYQSFNDTHSYKIDYTNVQWLGDSTAPVSVIMYVSMTCPLCKVVYQLMYDTLRLNPKLKKTMCLGVKYRSNNQYNRILAATVSMEKQPDFLRQCADIEGRIDEQGVKRITRLIGLSFDTLESRANSAAINEIVSKSDQESIDNGVEYTPGIFINNHRYYSTKSPYWILDAVRYYDSAGKNKGTVKK
jgi:protein-disulfide isomerase